MASCDGAPAADCGARALVSGCCPPRKSVAESATPASSSPARKLTEENSPRGRPFDLRTPLFLYANLFGVMNNDFSSAIIRCDLACDLNPSALQRSEVSEAGTVRCKNDTAKAAISVILTEVQKGAAGARGENAQHPPFDAGILARMEAGLRNSNASSLRNCGAVGAVLALRSVAQADAVSHHGDQNDGRDAGHS